MPSLSLTLIRARRVLSPATVHRALNLGRERLHTVHGYKILLNTTESHMMYLRSRGRYELAKHRLVAAIMERAVAHAEQTGQPANGPAGVFIDIGANKGDFALMAAQASGDRGLVVAVEPAPDNVRCIAASVLANAFKNVRVVAAAASHADGTATLHLAQKSGWHTLVADQPKRSVDATEVRTLTLDTLVEESGGDRLARIDAIKIDVEGHENAVLDGGSRTLERFRPIVMLDTHPQLGADIPRIETLFRDLGYRMVVTAEPTRSLDKVPPGEADVTFVPSGVELPGV